MTVKKGLFVFVLWLVPTLVSAQAVFNPVTAAFEFTQGDFNAIVPVGEVGAGLPVVTGFQGALFLAERDVNLPGVIPVGANRPVISKTLAIPVPGTTPQKYSLTAAQLGVALPVCTVVAPATCPVYTLVLVAVGPGGASLWNSGSESDSFMLAASLLSPTSKPANPGSVRIRPSL